MLNKGNRSLSLLTAAILFVTLTAVFWSCPSPRLSDAAFTVLLSEQLLENQSFRLDEYVREPQKLGLPLEKKPGATGEGLPYQLHRFDGHVYLDFPPGSSILSMPLVAVMNAFGYRAITEDGSWSEKSETMVQRALAALLCAAIGVAFFYLSMLYLPLHLSVIVAYGGALGTQVWSTASKALWSHTWATLLLASSLCVLLYRESHLSRYRAAALATILAWAVIVRPSSAVFALVLTLYILRRHREHFLVYIGVALFWDALLIAYSWYHFHRPMPYYFGPVRLIRGGFDLERILGHLVSPSRGLLIYVPVTIWIVYAVARYLNVSKQRFMALLMSGGAAFYLLFILGRFDHWWGGHCYGSRLTLDLIPFLVMLAVIALQARLEYNRRLPLGRRRLLTSVEGAIGIVLLSASIAVNGIGACSPKAWHWNVGPPDIDQAPERLWDWKEPQFMAPFLRR